MAKSTDPDVRWDEGYKAGLREVQRSMVAESRERIATAALAAILANSDPSMRDGAGTIHDAAVQHADQLLAALNARKPTDG